MLQVTEVGNAFYIDWYQGFAGDMYAKTMKRSDEICRYERCHLRKSGIKIKIDNSQLRLSAPA